MSTEIKVAANIVLAKAGLNRFDWAFVQSSTSVLRLNFCAKNPHHRQYLAVSGDAMRTVLQNEKDEKLSNRWTNGNCNNNIDNGNF